jgi:hypothetical protein
MSEPDRYTIVVHMIAAKADALPVTGLHRQLVADAHKKLAPRPTNS